ncbi:MAG TPA: tetratricopeptide repeat protein [Anaeromyxobacteraceae bacterium]|nr:tetratricopeptide repeat protein [Anaeromyxobacteraceae bacterium]
MISTSLCVALVASAAVAAEGAPAGGSSAAAAAPLDVAIARVDAAWPRRDEPGALDEARRALDEAAGIAPASYGVLWREARLEAWRSEDPAISDGEKSALGKKAWDLAERAIAADPASVEGYFYAVAGMGNYSLGIGILSALAQGIEGKFKARLSRAAELSPGFQSGAVPTAWGRFWFKLPWPKHDGGKCARALREALAMNPDNVRARVYLGDLHADEGRDADARAEYQAALAKPPGQYDAPEERRWQGVARAALDRLDRRGGARRERER